MIALFTALTAFTAFTNVTTVTAITLQPLHHPIFIGCVKAVKGWVKQTWRANHEF
jgi:hypothetical protein